MSEGSPARRGRGSGLDMVRSMVLVLAVIAVLFVLAPQPDQQRLPALDDASAVTAVASAGDLLGAPPVLVLGGGEREVFGADPDAPPLFLGEGWQLDYARTEQAVDDVPTWRFGLLSPEDRRVDVEQARSEDVTDVWLARTEGENPPTEAEVAEDPAAAEARAAAEVEAVAVTTAAEPLDVAGTTWERLRRADGRTAYVREVGGVTTVVSAADDAAYLAEVVALLSGTPSAG